MTCRYLFFVHPYYHFQAFVSSLQKKKLEQWEMCIDSFGVLNGNTAACEKVLTLPPHITHLHGPFSPFFIIFFYFLFISKNGVSLCAGIDRMKVFHRHFYRVFSPSTTPNISARSLLGRTKEKSVAFVQKSYDGCCIL